MGTVIELGVLAALNAAPEGLTNQELAEMMSYHGPVSGATSLLHYEGKIARLKERRRGWVVYVALDHVGDREVIDYHHRLCPNCGYDLTGDPAT